MCVSCVTCASCVSCTHHLRCLYVRGGLEGWEGCQIAWKWLLWIAAVLIWKNIFAGGIDSPNHDSVPKENDLKRCELHKGKQHECHTYLFGAPSRVFLCVSKTHKILSRILDQVCCPNPKPWTLLSKGEARYRYTDEITNVYRLGRCAPTASQSCFNFLECPSVIGCRLRRCRFLQRVFGHWEFAHTSRTTITGFG